MFIKRFLLFFLIIVIQKEATSQIINEIATKVSGYEIPILIHLPSNNEVTKSPVYFFVHGGGWNGGDENLVPNARLPADSDFLANNLGIIYVGLAYRCKGNNATFENAIEDLEASVKWFCDNASRFNADISRIAFGGASAGSTLSAILAQKYKNCKVYIGFEGMYNLVDHSVKLSPFPSYEARKKYGLDSKAKSKKASAYYNLRNNPTNSLLIHGDSDMLCHYSQSQKIAFVFLLVQFLRKEQALLRIEQAEKQKKFLQQLKLDKQIEKFRVREVKELEKLEKISLKEQLVVKYLPKH